jgi:hypothetical protein
VGFLIKDFMSNTKLMVEINNNVIVSRQRDFIMAVLPLIEQRFGRMMHEIKEFKEPLKRWQEYSISNVCFMQIITQWLNEREY